MSSYKNMGYMGDMGYMRTLENIEVIIFDFDGVLVDSMEIRDLGYRKILSNYPEDKIEELIKYHRINGGLSRFHKIEYFYKNILKRDIKKDRIIEYSNDFSEIMKDELTNKKYIIEEWIEFIEKNKDKYVMHIASGSEEKELNYICEKLEIDCYFKTINGSPVHKNELVKKILQENNYNKEKVVLVGDSINDYDAAMINGIKFIGYNNVQLKNKCENYIEVVQ